MSKFYTLSLADEMITFTKAFEKKLNNGNAEAYALYLDIKTKYPTFKITVGEIAKRSGEYDHTSMADIQSYISDGEHDEWKTEFEKLFGEMIPSKTNATKSVRKVKFAVIRKWFVEKRNEEEENRTKSEHKAARDSKLPMSEKSACAKADNAA